MPKNKRQKTYPPPPSAPSTSVPSAPSHIPTKSNIAGDFASNVVSGFAFGTGSSIARNVIDNMFKEPIQESTLHTEYLECLKHNQEDTCKTFFPNK